MSDGFLHCVKLDGQGGITDLDPAEVNMAVRQGESVWVHLDYSWSQNRPWLASLDAIPAAAEEALFAEDTRPRTTRIGAGLLLSLRGVNLNPDSEPSDMVALRIWMTPTLLITSRRRRLLSVQDTLQQLRQGQGPHSIAAILAQLAQTLTARMATTIETLEDHLAEFEERITANPETSMRATLVEKRLETVRLRRFLWPQKDAIARLAVESTQGFTEEQQWQIKEAANELSRYLEALEALRERSVLMQEEFVNLQAEKMNARMYVLSLLSAIFLPLGFLTGLFGINIGGMPGTENAQAFWWFCAVLLTLGGLFYGVMRKSRWF